MSRVFPAHWDVLSFSEAVKDATSEYSKLQKSEYLEQGVFPIVDQGQQQFGGYTNDRSVISVGSCPAIVFGDHTRIFKFIGEPFCLGADGAKVLEPKAELDKKFLFYYLSSLNIESAGYSRHFKFLKENVVPVPPLSEQKRIAAILDKADAIRRKRQQAIQLADDFLRAVFLDMFGDPVTNPKGWGLRKFSEVCRQITVGVVVKPASYYVESGVPAIRSLNIKNYGVNRENFVFFSSEDNETTLSKSRVYAGDLVIVRSGQPGKAAVVTKDLDGVNAIDVLIARPDSGYLNSDYLAYFFNSGAAKSIVLAEGRGQIQQHLNVGSLNAAEIPIPPLDLQREFADILEKVKDKYLCSDEAPFGDVFNSISQRAFSGQL